MNKLLLALAFLAVFPGVVCAAEARSPRFIPLEIHIDSPEPVAAWQFELKDRKAVTTVVGVENGSHAAFRKAPYYDREAVSRGTASRIVVADYSLADASQLPVGRFRLATLHLMLRGEPDFELRLIATTASDGRAIDASISIEESNPDTQERSP